MTANVSRAESAGSRVAPVSAPSAEQSSAEQSSAESPSARQSRLDSHLHLWQLKPGEYSWLQPSHGLLYADFESEQAAAELAGAGVTEAILVQADDTEADLRAMLSHAEAHDFIRGVVGWLPLEDPVATGRALEKYLDNEYFVGVRVLIHDDPRPNVLELPAVRKSLALLAEAGLAFDIPDAFPRHLKQAAELAADIPTLSIVIDHLGKPPRASGPEAMARWAEELRQVAAQPNTMAKVSGLNCPGAEFSASALTPVWDIALDAFGPERLMFGGDWPVSLLGAPYARTVEVIAEMVDAGHNSLSASERTAFWSANARKTYSR